MRDVYGVLKGKGITLPQPSTKEGVYIPVQELGKKFLHCSDCGPDSGNGGTAMDKLGKDLTVENDQEAVYNRVLGLLTNLSDKTGDLSRIKRFVKILALVSSADDFRMQPQVANEGPNLIAGLFGEEAGFPACSAIGTNALPRGIACETEVLVELK